jgi:hypothetical protein
MAMTVDEKKIRKAQQYKDNREKIIAQRKKYRIDNAEKVKLQDYTKGLKWRLKNENYYRDWQRGNPEKVKRSKELFKQTHPGKQSEYDRKHAPRKVDRCRTRRYTDPMYALKLRLRRRLRSVFKGKGIKKTDRTLKLLGCSSKHAVQHLANNDRGLKLFGKDIHVDHIRPFDSFKNLHCEFEQRTVNHYLNLQLLPAEENHRKGSGFDYDSWAASDAGKQLLELNRQWRMERYFQ